MNTIDYSTKENLTDTYDSIKWLAEVKDKKLPGVSDDWKLSRLDDEILNSKLSTYIMEQHKIIFIIEKYLSVPDNATPIYNDRGEITEWSHTISPDLQTEIKRITSMLLNDLQLLHIISQSNKGYLITEIFNILKQPQMQTEQPPPPPQTIMERLTQEKK